MNINELHTQSFLQATSLVGLSIDAKVYAIHLFLEGVFLKSLIIVADLHNTFQFKDTYTVIVRRIKPHSLGESINIPSDSSMCLNQVNI